MDLPIFSSKGDPETLFLPFQYFAVPSKRKTIQIYLSQ